MWNIYSSSPLIDKFLELRQFAGGLLRIQSVQPQDAGVYLCIRGEQTQYVRLEVDTAGMELPKELQIVYRLFLFIAIYY